MMMKAAQIQRVAISRRSLVVKATGAPPPAPPPTPVPTPPPARVSTPIPIPAAAFSPIDAMAFSGPAPEIINGRLAMLGFVAAIGAELTSDEAVAVQWSEAAVPILGTFAIFILASFIPLIKGADPKTESGPFTPAAELVNGRAAMIGFLALIVIEALSGKALI